MRTMLCFAAATFVVCLAVPGVAQQGHLALYADPEGTETRIDAHPGMPVDAYLVLFTEDLVNAVAFDVAPPPGVAMFPVSYGPHGNGINVPTSGGYNVGLGECCSGGSGAPILVATFMIIAGQAQMPCDMQCQPNTTWDPTYAVYSRCGTSTIVQTEFGPDATLITDFVPPTMTVDLNRYALWPPNHKMVDISAFLQMQDDVDPAPVCVLSDIGCSDPDDGLGDGSTSPDVQYADVGTLDTQFQLRAERSALGPGRVYTIVYAATDASGNTVEATVEVEVPHSQGGSFMPGPGFPVDGFAAHAQSFDIVIPSTVKHGKPYPVTPTTDPRDAPGGASPRYDFNAAALIPDRVMLGNTAGVVRPALNRIDDANGDGALDLVLTYPIPAVQVLLGTSTGKDGPVGLHYEAVDGTDYLVKDVFRFSGVGSVPPPDDILADPKSVAPPTGLVGITPNPFNPSAKIVFAVAVQQSVRIDVFSLRGELVRTLENRVFPAGRHDVVWDGRDRAGNSVASGVYVFSLRADGLHQTQKALLLK